MSRKRLLFALKLAVTVAATVLILWQADWAAIGRGLADADPLRILVVFACMTACVTLSAYKWGLLLDIHGAPFPFGTLHRAYFVAMFFNNFLPTSIGGDGYRVYRTWRNGRSHTAAVLAVFVERLSGIVSLLAIGWVAALAGAWLTGHPLSRLVAWAGVIGVVAAVALLWYLVRGGGLARLVAWRRCPGIVQTVVEHLRDYARAPGGSLWVVIVSLGFHAFTLVWMMALLEAVGAELGYRDLAVIAALLAVVAVVPISINGIGVMDGAFILLAGRYGVEYDAALLFMLAQRALLIPISLIGALAYFTGRERGDDSGAASEGQHG